MTIEVSPRLSPRIIKVPSPATSITMQQLVDQGRDWEDDPWNMTYSKLLSGSGKQDLGGGVSVGITVQLENAKLSFEARTTSTSSGTVTSNDTTGTILTDIGATFQDDGVTAGACIINFTTKSVATVITINSQTEILHERLDDGTSDTWTIGDEYKIWNVVQVEATGGNLVAVDTDGNSISAIFPTAFTQVVRTSSASATIAELEIKNLQYMIESSREGPAGFGSIFYVSPYDGNDLNDGTSPSTSVATVAKALSLCTNYNNDLIFLIAKDPSGITVLDESVNINIHTVSIRGPGQSFLISPSATNVNAITVSVNGASVDNVSLTTPIPGTGHGLELINAVGFRGEDLFIDNTGNCGIKINGSSDYTALSDITISGCMGDGIHVNNVFYCKLEGENIIHSCAGNGIHVDGTSHGFHVFSGTDIHANGEYGIHTEPTTKETFIHPDTIVFSNGYRDVLDEGIEGLIAMTLGEERTANLQYIIESNRGSHAGYNRIWFWDPYSGDDLNDGTRPERAYKTFSKSLNACSAGKGDVIFALAKDLSGTTYIDEILTINKNNVSLRGPGRNFVFRPTTGAGNAITISSYGVEISGFVLDGSMSTNTNGIYTNGDFTLIRNIWVDGLDGDAITIGGGDYNTVKDIFSHHNPGGSGIIVTGDSDHTTIIDSHIGSNGGDGIYVEITDVNKHEVNIIGSTIIHKNSGYGIRIMAQSKSVIIHPEVQIFANTLGNIHDDGTGTYDGTSEYAQVITNTVWDEPTSGHISSGSFGEKINKKLLTVGKFLGLK